MPENTPYNDLKEAIKKLEKEQANSRKLLKDQLKFTYERLKPFNILRTAFSNIIKSPEIRNNLLWILIPLATAFLSKKTLAAPRRRPVIKQAGILLSDRLYRYIFQNPEAISTISYFILSFFRRKKSPR